jgi:hypothetical protein
MRLFSQHFIDTDAPRRAPAVPTAGRPDSGAGAAACVDDTREQAMPLRRAGA